jgi:hypothetical protein
MEAFAILCLLIEIALLVVVIAGSWKMYEKANEPGWACLIPIYNGIVLLRIVGRPAWQILLFFVPIVGLIMSILVFIELAGFFGKGAGFAVGLILLGFVFIPILGFGDAVYDGPNGRTRTKKKKKKKVRDDFDDDFEDDFEEDDRPRKKQKRIDDDFDDDFEDDDQPRKAKKKYDDDLEDDDYEEPRPKSKKKYDFDDDFEEERPRKKEQGVKSISRRDEDDEDFDDEPLPKKKEQVQAKLPAPPPVPANAAAGKIVQCSSCQKKLKIPATAVGKKVKCPGCGEAFVAK